MALLPRRAPDAFQTSVEGPFTDFIAGEVSSTLSYVIDG